MDAQQNNQPEEHKPSASKQPPSPLENASAPKLQPERKPSWNLGPRELPESAPDRIKFGSRLVLYKKMQNEDMAMYMVHIKGKPTFIFIMNTLDPQTAIDWKGAFRGRDGVLLADRDGVVKDSRFLNDTEKSSAEDVMVPSALEASAKLNKANIGLGIVTNQGGYQWGRMSFEDMIAINVRVIQQIANAGGHVDAVFVSPFATPLEEHTDGVYDARKPAPGMFMYAEQLAAANGVEVLAATGDQRTDGAAAQGAGQKFFAITGSSGRWNAERISAEKNGKTLPDLNTDPGAYQEVTEFADVVDVVLAA
jgi:D-glycero-D-manno-heptose 1,7-bisphosphate phosphatase